VGAGDESKGAALMSNQLTIADFLQRAQAKHGKGRYDYSQVDYVNVSTKVVIVCRDHGPFLQAPYHHTEGRGCPACGGRPQIDTKAFIARAREVHNGRYDYGEVEYRNARTPVSIRCPEHGFFQQVASEHLKGRGCYECGQRIMGEKHARSHEDFIQRAQEVHGKGRYNYSKTQYIGVFDRVDIICPEHGVWSPLANNHLQGYGCPSCAVFGFKPDQPAVLYYARIDRFNEPALYMVGITKHSFAKRYTAKDREWMTLLSEEPYDTGAEAYEKEQSILREHAEHLCQGSSPLVSKGGETSREIFTVDVLGLDTVKGCVNG
jgi:hypothetical protein